MVVRPMAVGQHDLYVPVNSLRPRPNRRPFADDIFKCIFLNKNEWILPRISLKFVPKVRINNIPALGQIMAWRRPGDKPLSEPMMVDLLTHIMYESLGLNELINFVVLSVFHCCRSHYLYRQEWLTHTALPEDLPGAYFVCTFNDCLQGLRYIVNVCRKSFIKHGCVVWKLRLINRINPWITSSAPVIIFINRWALHIKDEYV